MTKIYLAVFDIDGTLTDSIIPHQSSFLHTLEGLRFPKINSNWATYLHHTDSHILRENFRQNRGREMNDEEFTTFEEQMQAYFLAEAPITAIKGAAEFVKHLWEDTPFAISFATGSLYQPALTKLQQANIPHHEKLLATANRMESREAIVTDAIERAKSFFEVTHFERIFSFGDGLWDLNTAKNLDLEFIGIGEKSVDLFKEKQAKHFVNFTGITQTSLL